ncbi:hypothetical protein [Mesorhizobium atlanticum]|uniref:hypothetical protein n=1 Tax=Mesorhizobium atlanticum TaxID=2233532 RepID=UPI0015ECACC7|nr:hypothetical protein [Mesorhizobium atlanticum]
MAAFANRQRCMKSAGVTASLLLPVHGEKVPEGRMRGRADAYSYRSCRPLQPWLESPPDIHFEHHFASVTAGLANSLECIAGATNAPPAPFSRVLQAAVRDRFGIAEPPRVIHADA